MQRPTQHYDRPSLHEPRMRLATVLLSTSGLLLGLYAWVSARQVLSGSSAVVVPTREYDFGVVDQTTRLEHGFLVQNRGRSPFEILKVVACCGAQARIEGSRRVNPGESRTIQVVSGSGYQLGGDRRTADVYTNDLDRPRITLAMSWVVVADVRTAPKTVDFGELGEKDVAKRGNLHRIVHFVYPPKGFQLTGCRSSSPALEATVQQVSSDALYRTIRIDFDPGLTSPGEFRGVVFVGTNQAGRREISIPVLATVPNVLAVSPAALALGIIGRHSSVRAQAQIDIRSHGSAEPKIVAKTGGLFRLSLQRSSTGGTYLLTAVAARRLPPGPIHDTIQVQYLGRCYHVPITAYVDPNID
jgi:hypothetical protein